MGSARALAACATLLASGCAQNAFFELQVSLPPASGEYRYAQIQVRDQNGHDFDIPWMGGDLPTVPLGSTRQWSCTSVQSRDPTVSLNVRVRFCVSENCLELRDGEPPERLYSFERPFYIGARTYYRIVVPEVPLCDSCPITTPGVCVDGTRCACRFDEECCRPGTADCGREFGYTCEPDLGCVEQIDRCSIEGCIEGPVSATFCSMESGQHFCEKNPDILRDDSYVCSRP